MVQVRPDGVRWPVVLLNRQAERAALDRLLEAAQAGHSAVLVMRGAPGIGKTALIEDAIESAAGFRVAPECEIRLTADWIGLSASVSVCIGLRL